MKLIFLDIDGILVVGTHNWGLPIWNQESIASLKFILEKTSAKIVLSSTWRLKPASIYHFIKMLIDYDIKAEVIGYISNIGLFSRDKEIIKYLDDLANARLLLNNKDFVRDWIVIDDAPEFFTANIIPKNRLYIIDRNKGLTREDTLKILNHFDRGNE